MHKVDGSILFGALCLLGRKSLTTILWFIHKQTLRGELSSLGGPSAWAFFWGGECDKIFQPKLLKVVKYQLRLTNSQHKDYAEMHFKWNQRLNRGFPPSTAKQLIYNVLFISPALLQKTTKEKRIFCTSVSQSVTLVHISDESEFTSCSQDVESSKHLKGNLL